jgi:hypothetical protein
MKDLQLSQASKNDQRMKLVNDMVNGIRTIKSYGWETHYLEKITEVRKLQRTEIMKANAL